MSMGKAEHHGRHTGRAKFLTSIIIAGKGLERKIERQIEIKEGRTGEGRRGRETET